MEVNITVPTSWNELSNLQLKNIVYQLECYQNIIKDNAKAMALASQNLYLQICKELIRHNNWRSKRIVLKEVQPKYFEPLNKFIYKKVQRTRFIESVKIKGVRYFAPDIRLRNSVIAEFSFADAIFYKWRQTHEPIWLDVLCATLYREKAESLNDIDIRKPFVKQAVDNRADKFINLTYDTKLAIAYTYEGCRNHIAETFPAVFPKPIVDEDGKPQKKTLKKKYVSFGEIILEKIEGDPSKLETTNNVLTYDFLSIYNKDILDMRKKK